MSKHAKPVSFRVKYATAKPTAPVGRHAAPAKHRAKSNHGVVRRTVTVGGLAAAATGVAVTGGVLSTNAPVIAADAPVSLGRSGTQADITAADLQQRQQPAVTRSDRRTNKDATKVRVLGTDAGGGVAQSENLDGADPRTIGRALLGEYGFADSQFACLDALYVSESNWRVDADNPTSSAYGIPQALTGLHDMPAGYYTDAEVQIRWGLDYIQRAYGTPCNAWSFKRSQNWY